MNEQDKKEMENGGIFYYTGEQARAESVSLSLSPPTVIFNENVNLELESPAVSHLTVKSCDEIVFC